MIDAILPSAAEREFILATADAGIGRVRNWTVANDILSTDSVLFPAGNSVMNSSVRGAMELSVFVTVARTYS